MRLPYACLSLVIAGGAARAAATSCYPHQNPWQDPSASPIRSDVGRPGVEVPVDASVWETISCAPREPPTTPACQLIDETGAHVPLTITLVGASYCDRPVDEHIKNTNVYYLRHYTPTQPLTPGLTYSLECEDAFPGTFTVRDAATPAAAPTPLELDSTWFRRGDDGGCCGGGGDVIELYLADMSPAYLAEGGYIEVLYPNGQRLVLGPTDDDHLELPGTRDDLELTPVSASGARGETLTIAGDDIDGDAVYIPCDIRGQRPTAALWLLLPMIALRVQARRRRSA